MSEEKKAAKKQKTEREIWEEQEAARKADIEARRVHPHLVIPAIRFYQADDASESPGAWYAVMHAADGGPPMPDVRLDAEDSEALHALAQKLAGGR